MHPTRWIAPLLALVILCAPALAQAAAPPGIAALVGAIRANDVTTLEAIARGTAPPAQRALAHGTVLALRRQDAQAIAALQPVSRAPTDPTVRANALIELASVFMRDGRYRDCYDAFRAAARLSPRSMHHGDDQSMAFAHALIGVKPMRVVRAVSGSLPITRDKAGLMRVRVTLDAHPEDAVIDTGAGFSTISATTAQRLGLRMLDQNASVSSSTKRTVPTQLGIARRLQLGQTVLSNVVFIVLPDSALSFAHGAYTINTIVGLPVLLALRRIEFVDPAGTPRLKFGAGPRIERRNSEAHAPNVLLSALTPLVLVNVPGASAPLRLQLDTGANATLFAQNAVQTDPQLLRHATTHRLRLGGAGGETNDPHALSLPAVTLDIGTERFFLKHVAVQPGGHKSSEGTLGLDVLRQGARVILDFRTMQLRIVRS